MRAQVPALATELVVRDDAGPASCLGYVTAHPLAASYHQPAWTGVISRAFGHDTKYLAAFSGARIVGVLPLVFFRSRLFGRFAVSMPFVNYGGVLADGPDAQRALLRRAVDETTRAGGTHLELRHTRQLFHDLPSKRHKVAMRLGLERAVEGQWQRLDRKLRNQIRKAEKSGLDVHVGGMELLDRFYAVFARHMRDLGTPVYAARFFREVVSAFPDDTRVFVVTLAGRPVAASIVHWYRDAVEVPWASAIRDFNPLCINVLLYWHMLRFSIERGFRRFDFGRSTPGGGTFLFKKQWGAEPEALVWEYWMAEGRPLPDISPNNQRYAGAIGVWQRLPVRVATTIGPFIVRNIP